MKKALLLLLLLPAFVFAQNGMVFEHAASWKAVQAKAKAEKKFIFMDAFTTWCGPCKMMAATIFPQPQVGAFFNERFINVKVQLDSTKKDNEEVKAWYSDAHNIMNDYNVNVFPTYLFFDPNGKLVHRAVGSSEAEKFIAKAKDALNPETQYYTLLHKYKTGERDAAFLLKTAKAARDAYDMSTAGSIAKDYLATQKDLSTKDNIEFIDQFTGSSKDNGFAFILNNSARFDEVLGKGAANKKLIAIIKQEELFPVIWKSSGTPDWNAISTNLTGKYPVQAEEVLLGGQVLYYQTKKDWNGFQTAVQQYMKKYGAVASAGELNQYAWMVFENCKDMTCVADALEWSKQSFKDKDNPMYIDTYANILYKLGRKEEAITWEQKALALVNEAEKKDYQETLNKMKKGEKTWKD